MASIDATYPIKCSAERVKVALLDERFHDAFVGEQHPTDKAIQVDRAAQRSVLSWTIRLDGDLPGVVTQFVGRKADLHLVFDLADMTLLMTAKAKRNGKMNADFSIEPVDAANCTFRITGEVSVGGFMGGLAESTVRDQVIKPVIGEDLVRLLEEWCDREDG